MISKEYKKVLFCVPPFEFNARMEDAGTITKFPCMPTTGIGYLSEMLTKHGIDNYVFDFRLGYGSKDFLNRINELKPDLIGVGMLTYRHDLAYDVVKKVKKFSPTTKIVAGGPHVSLYKSKVLEGCDVDFAVKFEGEHTIVELCNGVDPKEIKGLIYKDGQHIVENEDRLFIKNLDEIPFPHYGKFELGHYIKMIPIITSRGCPYNCIYCTTGSMGKKYRGKSAENVVSELKYWHNKGYRNFDFLDDNFTMLPERVHRICDLVEKNNLVDMKIHCSNGIRTDRTNKDLLKRMQDIGFKYVCFGVEAGNNKILKTIKKGVTIETQEQAIKNACELGFDVGLFFMVGHPGETTADVEDSIRLALKYPVALAKFLNVIPYPGTELFEWIKKNNYFVGEWHEKLTYAMHLDDDPFFETPELPLKERKKLLNRTAKVWVEVKKRYVKRKLERRYGALGNIIATILYLDPIYGRLWRSYNEKEHIRKLVNLMMKILGVRIVHF